MTAYGTIWVGSGAVRLASYPHADRAGRETTLNRVRYAARKNCGEIARSVTPKGLVRLNTTLTGGDMPLVCETVIGLAMGAVQSGRISPEEGAAIEEIATYYADADAGHRLTLCQMYAELIHLDVRAFGLEPALI